MDDLFQILKKEFEEIVKKSVREEFTKYKLSQNEVDKYKLLTKKEVAKLLKVSEGTVDNLKKRELIKPIRIGKQLRYKESDLFKKFTEE